MTSETSSFPWTKASTLSRADKSSTSYQYEELSPDLKRGYKDVKRSQKIKSYGTGVLLCLLLLAISANFSYWILYVGSSASGDFAEGCAMTADQSPLPLYMVTNFVGNFTFSEAKAIDAAWNLIVGHGGRFVLTWISFKVFVSSLYRIAEQSMVTVDSYTDIALFGSQLITLWSTLKALRYTKGARVKASISFMVFTLAFILAWPTLLDITTGYVPRQTLMVALDNGYLLPFDCDDSANDIYAVFFCNQTDTAQGSWTCVPDRDGRFAWGFSMMWVWIVTGFMNIWAWGLFGLWVDSFKYSQTYHQLERPGTYRVILDIAGAISASIGPDVAVSSNQQLKERFQTSKMRLKWHTSSTSLEPPILRAHTEPE